MQSKYDAFISYRHHEPDKAFARNIVSKLETAGFKVAVDERDFSPNATFLEEMERCVKESAFTLAVVSPRYFESSNAQEEAVICKVLGMQERRRRLIPLIIERVQMPTWMFDIVGVDFTASTPLVDPVEKLKAALRAHTSIRAAGPVSSLAQRALKGSTGQVQAWHVYRKTQRTPLCSDDNEVPPGILHGGSTLVPHWPNPVGMPDVPEVPRYCFGRGRESRQIHDAIRGNCGMVCVLGPSGEGKSTLVAQWLGKHKVAKHRGLFYCRPDSKHYKFGHFIDDCLRYITDGRMDLGNRSSLDRVVDLCIYLRERPTILVIDDLEPWLCRRQQVRRRASDQFPLKDRAPTDAAFDILLKAATTWDNGSAVVITSRALPCVLDERQHREIGTLQLPGGHRTISPLTNEASIRLLRSLGVRGSRAQLVSLTTRYNGHALLLSVVGSALLRLYGGDISKYTELNPLSDDPAARLSKILLTIAQHHKEDWELLTVLACHPASMSIGLLQHLMMTNEKEMRARVSSLVDWHLVVFDGRVAYLHPFIREIVYSSCGDSVKRVFHQRIAEAIESQPKEFLNENCQLLAQHYEFAGNSLKAFHYWLIAAEKAVSTVAAFEGFELFEHARRLAATRGTKITEEQELRMYSGLGLACFRMRLWQECNSNYNRVLQLAFAHRQYKWRSQALAQLGYAKLWEHDFSAALAYARRAKRIAKRCRNGRARALSLLTEGWAYAVKGRLGPARGALEHGRNLAKRARDVETEALSVCLLGHLSNWKGDFATATAHWEEVLRIARAEGLVGLRQWGLFSAGMGYCALNEYERALTYLQEGKSLCEAIGDRAYLCRMLNTMGWIYMDVCNWKDAIKSNNESATESRELMDIELIFNSEINLADCYLATHRVPEAKRLLEGLATEAARRKVYQKEWMGWRYTQRLWYSLGKLRLLEGELESALDYARRCLRAAEKSGSKRNRVKGHRLMAEAFLARRQFAVAIREAEKAVVIARSLGNLTQLWETYSVLGRIALKTCDLKTAREALSSANQCVENIASRLRNPLRNVFLRSSQVREIRQLGVSNKRIEP